VSSLPLIKNCATATKREYCLWIEIAFDYRRDFYVLVGMLRSGQPKAFDTT